MKYDYIAIYEKNAAFYNAHPTAKRALKLGNLFLTGLFFAAYGILWLCVLWLEEYDLKLLTNMLFVPFLALFIVTALRLAIDRPRPYHEDGSNIQPLIHKKKGDKKSFPSRHLACAGVISMTVLAIYPLSGAFLLAASFLLGYIRFAAGLHYPSDLIIGEGIGILVGLLAFLL